MKIRIHDEVKDIQIQTISVTHNLKDPETIYLFRCHRCGDPISQVAGMVIKIFPGIEPSASVHVINKCGKCKELYTFQTLDTPNYDYTRVVLSVQKPINTFHCFICRNPLLQFNADIVALLPTFRQIQLPHIISCINTQCSARYNVVDVV